MNSPSGSETERFRRKAGSSFRTMTTSWQASGKRLRLLNDASDRVFRSCASSVSWFGLVFFVRLLRMLRGLALITYQPKQHGILTRLTPTSG